MEVCLCGLSLWSLLLVMMSQSRGVWIPKYSRALLYTLNPAFKHGGGFWKVSGEGLSEETTGLLGPVAQRELELGWRRVVLL